VSTWWRDAVLYQVYPRSYRDSDGDGIGDLPGIVASLDHLEWLGIDGLWLNPVMPSPNADWGYDVADYCEIHRQLGTLADLDHLVEEAGRRGIRVLLDLVPNHTSDRHPWFQEALADPGGRHRSWYVWASPGPDGGPPNNWLSAFGGPAWTLDETSQEYYLHGFLPEQPDLDWWNEELREEFDRILRFWFDRGIAGFRIDVAHRIVKDRQLRHNLPVTEDDHPHIRALGQRQTHTANQPELHTVLRRWRGLAESYEPPRLLLGETYVLDVADLAGFYGSAADELQLAFNFVFVHAELDAVQLAEVVEATLAALPADAWPVWTGSNHDAGRLASRWCDGDERRVRCALTALLTLRGTPVLYYGDELGLPDVDVPRERILDPVGVRAWPKRGRDPCRTPMHWRPGPAGGFTSAPGSAWLPLGDTDGCNVEDQRADRGSVLHLCRDLIALRRSRQDLRGGAYERLRADRGVWAWRRGARTSVALNLSDGPRDCDDVHGTIRLSSGRERDGSVFDGRLAAWEAVVVEDG
jgi:alpha-glucosidase